MKDREFAAGRLFFFRSGLTIGGMDAVDREDLISLLAEAIMREALPAPLGR